MVLRPLLLPLPLRSLTHSRSLTLTSCSILGDSQSIAFEAAGLLRALPHLPQCDRVKKTCVVQDPGRSQGRGPSRPPDAAQTQRESWSLFFSHINQRDEQGQSELIT